MSEDEGDALLERWQDAREVAWVLALEPGLAGGAVVRASPGPIRDAWLDAFRRLARGPVLRLPVGATEDRIVGGMDLAATLARGQLVVDQGVLARVHGGAVVVPMAERLPSVVGAHLCAVVDRREVRLEREGLSRTLPAHATVIALDEGIGEERLPGALADRLGAWLELDALPPRWAELFEDEDPTAEALREARALWTQGVRVSSELVTAVVGGALALGIGSLRAPRAALELARGRAALAGRPEVGREDIAFASRVVLAPRAQRAPAPEEPESPPEPADETSSEVEHRTDDAKMAPPEDIVLEAVRVVLPEGALEALASASGPSSGVSPGASGIRTRSKMRGRPKGTRPGYPGRDGRIDLVATLRTAAPWQQLRGGGERIRVTRADLRVKRYEQRSETLAIFVVDASGSAALARMAEAKGAVEHLLADCYSRRDAVALVAFRKTSAELLLPPTRALARARRCLAQLAGGGGTPIAAGLQSGLRLAEEARRGGSWPLLVLMSDGRANVGLDGAQGREVGMQDALAAASGLARAGVRSLVVDTANRPREHARSLAEAMAARYVPLPRSNVPAALSGLVRDSSGA